VYFVSHAVLLVDFITGIGKFYKLYTNSGYARKYVLCLLHVWKGRHCWYW